MDDPSILSSETEIIGVWKFINGQIEADVNCSRIWILANEYLEKLGRDESGWETLFRDPADGRYWMLVYPLGGMHGGGPQSLVQLSETDAEMRFPKLF